MTYRKNTAARKAISILPLFDWADSRQFFGPSYAARRLQQRFKLHPATARTIAEAGGFGGR